MKHLTAALLILCLLAGGCLSEHGGFSRAAWAEDIALSPAMWNRIKTDLMEDGNDPVPAEYRIPAKPLPWFLSWPEAGFETILLLSSDAPSMDENFGRAGVAILCTIQLNTGKIRLLSLPEQEMVRLAPLPEPVWFKFVNCFGGPLLMMETVTDTLGIQVNRYCAVNLNAFVRTLNQLGGTALTLTEEEAEALGLESGEQHLDGDQALRFVRLRSGNRAPRVRTLIETVGRRVLESTSLHDGLALVDFLITAIDTNLTTDDLLDAVFAVLEPENRPPVSFRSLDSLDASEGENAWNYLYGKDDAP